MNGRKRDFIVLPSATLAQLDQTLEDIKARYPVLPARGWLRTIRLAPGQTTRQFAQAAGVTHRSVATVERAEARGDVTLATLSRYAAALGCDLQYVLVPRKPLTQILDQRAEAVARELVARVRHSSALKGQATSEAVGEREIAALKRRLLDGNQSRLWRRVPLRGGLS
jgi:predicted DNA-binding mobile mystery protein A